MKKTVIAPLTTALILLFVVTSFASPAGDGKRGQRQSGQNHLVQIMNQLPPEKRALFESIMEEHRKETRPLHNIMWQKRTELKALSANPNTKPETLSAIVADMAKTRAALQEKGDALRARIKKEVGIDFPPSRFGQPHPGAKPGPETKPGPGAKLESNGPDIALADPTENPAS